MCKIDRVVIFDSRVGFSGTAYLMESSKFTPRITPVAMATKFGTKSAITLTYIRDIPEIFAYNSGFSGSGY